VRSSYPNKYMLNVRLEGSRRSFGCDDSTIMLLVLEMDRLLPTVDRPFKIECLARVAERVRIPTTVELRTVLCTL